MHVTLRNKKNIGLICFMLVSSSYFGLLCRTITLLGQKNLIIKSSCVNQIYYFRAIENILEFTCVTLYVTLYVPYVCIVYVYVTCVTYVMDNFIPNSVSIGFICLIFSTVRSQMCPKIACTRRESHLLHLFDFSPLCVFKRLFKSPPQ